MKASEHYLQYGNTIIPTAYCEKCRAEAWIIDGVFQCCFTPYHGFDSEQVKVVVPPSHVRGNLSRAVQRRLREQQGERCYYCGRLFGYLYLKAGELRESTIQYDHVIPFAFSSNNHERNFVAACNLCNLHKSDHIFNDINDLRRYLKERLRSKAIEIDEMD